LIRAMRDANIPKFLSEDAELFSAIVGDLFPDLAITPQDYGDLQRAVVACAKTAALQPIPSFVLKVCPTLSSPLTHLNQSSPILRRMTYWQVSDQK
jgi:hypothetical protein